MSQSALHVEVITPYGFDREGDRYRVTRTLPAPLRLLPFRMVRSVAVRRNEARVLEEARQAALGGKAVAYVWPDPSLSLLRQLNDAGVPIVREMINCHRGTAKAILDAEYRRLGLAPQHLISSESVDSETEALEYCSDIFCSNSFAERSLIDNGAPESKVRPVSFGWDPDRFRGHSRALEPIDGPTFVFVGSICVRKGAHLILRYWAASGIKGRLVMVGNVEPAIEQVCSEYLRRDDVLVIKYTRDIAPYYRSADVFVFPSLEEGGPQVTYEAAGCRLPLITSPMGAGRVADASTGYVLDPFDQSGWAEAMQSLAEDAELRRRMGSAAQQRALQFTWMEVGEARGRVCRQIARTAAASSAVRSPGSAVSPSPAQFNARP